MARLPKEVTEKELQATAAADIVALAEGATANNRGIIGYSILTPAAIAKKVSESSYNLQVFETPWPDPANPEKTIVIPAGSIPFVNGEGFTDNALYAAWVRDNYRDYKVIPITAAALEKKFANIRIMAEVARDIEAGNYDDEDPEAPVIAR